MEFENSTSSRSLLFKTQLFSYVQKQVIFQRIFPGIPTQELSLAEWDLESGINPHNR
jgi:hypothetical protein